MNLHIEHTVITIPDGAVDPAQSIRPGGATTVVHGQARSAPVQRTLPRISIDLGEPRPLPAARSGADLEVTGLLGEGGMGRVLLARQHTLHREVAVKTLKTDADDQARAALLEEGAIVGSLEHPGIIPVHALGLDDATNPILVMKRIEGVPLAELLADRTHEMWGEQRTPTAQLIRTVEILIHVCNALAFAHEHDVMHLDIKPSNVMVGRHGDVYLVDWGIARRMQDMSAGGDAFAGTPIFAAPEMVAGRPRDARTDVYLLGATLHNVLTGTPRHAGNSMFEVFAAAVQSVPFDYDDSVPAELARLAAQATSRDPDDRPASVVVFRRRLVDFLEHRSSSKLSETAASRVAELELLTQQDSEEGDVEHERRKDELAVEARFAIDQALEIWRDNPAAKITEDKLTRLIEARRQNDLTSRRVARDYDRSISAAQRTRALMTLVAGVSLASAIGVWTWAEGIVRTSRGLVIEGSVMLAFALLLVVRFRHRLESSLPNRMAMALLITLTGAPLVSRLIALAANTPTAEVLTRDQLLGATFAAIGSIWISRWHLLPVCFLVAGAAVSAVRVDLALLAFSLSTGSALVFVALTELRTSRRENRDG